MKALRITAVIAGVLLLGACATQVAPHSKVLGSGNTSVAVASPTPVKAAAASPAPAAVAPAGKRSVAAMSSWTTEQKIESYRRSLYGTRIADFPPAAYAGKNVIIIQVESLNAMLVRTKYNGHEVTPNLNKLIKQSWYWTNAYSETGIGNTADAEFIVNTSIYAPKGQAATVKYRDRTMPGLPRVLRGLGYYAFTIHPNKVTYWNRKQMYWELGFNRYYDRAFFKGAPFMGEFGASDEELYKRGVPLLTALAKKKTPFLSEFISLSSHGPFLAIPESKRPLRTPSELSGSLFGKYMSSESYSDYALGKFFKSLQTSGLWDKSIIVIYGDHTAMPSNTLSGKNAAGAKKLLGRAYNPTDRQRIPLIIHLPGETTGTVLSDTAGQVDIMPTVADLVGADLSGVPHAGRSLFQGSSQLVPFNAYLPGGSVANRRVLYMPGHGTLALPNGAKTSANKSDVNDQALANRIWNLTDAWVLTLPKFKSGTPGWIPDPVARAAAAKYGFPQH